jgi:hypothetical protein
MSSKPAAAPTLESTLNHKFQNCKREMKKAVENSTFVQDYGRDEKISRKYSEPEMLRRT